LLASKNFIANADTLITDGDARTCNQALHLLAWFPAERTVRSILTRFVPLARSHVHLLVFRRVAVRDERLALTDLALVYIDCILL
jgi:hypothetical protein